jgi:hypothetical protein
MSLLLLLHSFGSLIGIAIFRIDLLEGLDVSRMAKS